ncbi:MAG: hypothetical protein P0S96_08210 [Simkaniaceae bacterium]|nr:hypothetical protein [Candidatus Sacchlamyda saccharinae]
MRQVISFLLFLSVISCQQAKDLFVKQDKDPPPLRDFFVKSPEIEEEEPCCCEHQEYTGCDYHHHDY